MGFRKIQSCRRPEWQQEMVYLTVTHLSYMPIAVKDEAYKLIDTLTKRPDEGRALFEMLTKDITLESAWLKYGVPKGKLLKMRREFYDRFLSETIRR
ncbi:MAG: hypothetical protein IJT62_09195 [Oscillospiraceae bacterium]|nr:hypothetical protein [Oscillospiraceae bacterium]